MEVEKSPNRESSILLLSSEKRRYCFGCFWVLVVVVVVIFFRFVLFLELTSIGIVEKKKTLLFDCW